MSYTLLVTSDLFADKRKCVVDGCRTLEEMIANVKTSLSIGVQSPMGLSLITDEGNVPVTQLSQVPAKARVLLENRTAAHLPEGVPPAQGGGEPRDFLLLVTGTGGLDATPRKCKVSASSVADIQSALSAQFDVAAVQVDFNGAPLSDLGSLPAKAKVSVAPATSGGGSGQFNLRTL